LHHASRLASLGELAAGIAHEVNQPLCAVVNFARACGNLAAQDAPDLARIREWADAIASTAADAGDIIRRVIRFARRAQPDRDLVRVRELVDNAILLIHHEAEQRRVVLRANAIAEDLMVYVQSVSIQQVLVNLLRNGIESLEAVPPGNRAVCVDAAPRGDCVEITVSDNGAGLTDDCRKKIFEPFFTTKPRGLGLGLPLSRTIVEENAGRIWTTESQAGGLAVHFTLPTRKE
jgi:C4-dicarboxylate-specific signal transduction histidine kinase